MRKIIAAINMTIDGVYDHTALSPDGEVHHHYTELLNDAGAILYGRITYQLMQYWQPLVKNPSGEKSMDDFAMAIDRIPKIVFSNTLKQAGPEAIGWDSAKLSDQPLEEAVTELKQQAGKDILVGSRSLILSLTNLHLIDEYQLCVHPLIVGKGMQLFHPIDDRVALGLSKTKTFGSGAILLYYHPLEKE